MVVMGDTVTVTSKKMVTIPARIMKGYGLHEGSKVRFVEVGGNLLFVPVLSLKELHGIGKAHSKQLIEGARELEGERRAEAEADG
jgi:AbrB family looped-hinge helix DNA binding protein